MTMDPKEKQEWIDALKSGKYKKGKELLRRKDNTYCCLGVKYEIDHGKDSWVEVHRWMGEPAWYTTKEKEGWYPSSCVYHPEKLSQSNISKLMSINDSTNTFAEVIEYIEKHL